MHVQRKLRSAVNLGFMLGEERRTHRDVVVQAEVDHGNVTRQIRRLRQQHAQDRARQLVRTVQAHVADARGILSGACTNLY